MLFLRNVGLSSAAELAAGILAFAFTAAAARFLGLAGYSVFQALMGLYGIMTILILPLNLAVVHCTAVGARNAGLGPLRAFLRLAILLAGGSAAILAVFSPLVAGFLKIPGLLPVILTGCLVLAASILRVFYGYLQGRLQYRFFSAVKVIQAALTLVLGLVFIAAGAGAAGAIAGYLVSMVLINLYFLRKLRPERAEKNTEAIQNETAKLGSLLCVFLFLLLVEHLPVLAARSRLDADNSGYFAALYNLRNLVWPFVLSIAIPFYSQTVTEGGREKRLLLKGVGAAIFLSAAFTGAGLIFPDLILDLLYGEAFRGGAPYFAFYGVSLGCQMLTMILLFWKISRSERLWGIPAVGAVAFLVVLWLQGSSIYGIIQAQIAGCLAALVLIAAGRLCGGKA